MLVVGGGGSYCQQSDPLLGLGPKAPTRDTIVAEVNADVAVGFGSCEDRRGERDAEEKLGEGSHCVMLPEGGVRARNMRWDLG